MEKTTWKHKIANFLATRFKNIRKGYLGRQRFILTCWIYRILPFLGFDYCRLIEWKFVMENIAKANRNIKILDIGSRLSLFIYKLPDYSDNVFGFDVDKFHERLPGQIKFIIGDAMNSPLKNNSIDIITLISVIEHIGLGVYKDPVYEDGDFQAMGELKRVLRAGGALFITTVIGNKYIITPNNNTRIYDKKRFNELIEKFSIVKEEYYIFRRRWVPVDKERAFLESPVFLPSLKGFGLACLQLTKKQKQRKGQWRNRNTAFKEFVKEKV